MYGFQNEDFLKTLNGAVAQIGEINRIADKAVSYTHLYLILVGNRKQRRLAAYFRKCGLALTYLRNRAEATSKGQKQCLTAK